MISVKHRTVRSPCLYQDTVEAADDLVPLSPPFCGLCCAGLVCAAQAALIQTQQTAHYRRRKAAVAFWRRGSLLRLLGNSCCCLNSTLC